MLYCFFRNNRMHAVDIMIGRNDSEGAMWKLMLEGEMPESVQSLDKPTVRGIIQVLASHAVTIYS